MYNPKGMGDRMKFGVNSSSYVYASKICLRLSNHFDTGSSSNYQFDKGMSIWIGRVPTPIDQSLY